MSADWDCRYYETLKGHWEEQIRNGLKVGTEHFIKSMAAQMAMLVENRATLDTTLSALEAKLEAMQQEVDVMRAALRKIEDACREATEDTEAEEPE